MGPCHVSYQVGRRRRDLTKTGCDAMTITAFCTVLRVTSLGRLISSEAGSCRLHLVLEISFERDVMKRTKYRKESGQLGHPCRYPCRLACTRSARPSALGDHSWSCAQSTSSPPRSWRQLHSTASVGQPTRWAPSGKAKKGRRRLNSSSSFSASCNDGG